MEEHLKEPSTSSSDSGGDGTECVDKGSKSKKSRITIPSRAITSAKKRMAELDIIVEETPTFSNGDVLIGDFSIGVDCEQIVTNLVVETRDVSEGVTEIEKGKGKLGTTDVSDGYGPKVKRRYVKKNMEYWNNRKLTSFERKRKGDI